jgi:anti-sigma factor RsiW
MTNAMDCERCREALLDEQHGRLAPEHSLALRAHLAACAQCSKHAKQERWLSELLDTRLPRPVAPPALRARLAQQLLAAESPSKRRAFAPRAWRAGMSAAAAVLLATLLFWPRDEAGPITPHEPLVQEAVNDHLRVVYAEHPIEIESGGIHQVKPWFTGRLDFAPDLMFSGDADFPLLGGAIGYFIDRKAATLVFKRRLHTISCFVFRAQGLPWPRGEVRELAGGRVKAQVRTLDGFHILLWRDAELGHALVSDAGESELLQLGAKLVSAH